MFSFSKVADCILLMSLDKPDAIPVDTHMFQIAANQVKPAVTCNLPFSSAAGLSYECFVL